MPYALLKRFTGHRVIACSARSAKEQMRTYQARFDIDHSLHTMRCLLDGDRIVQERYVVLRFRDNIHLLNLLRRAGMPDQIAFGDGARTHWPVTFQQLIVLGYSEQQLKELGMLP